MHLDAEDIGAAGVALQQVKDIPARHGDVVRVEVEAVVVVLFGVGSTILNINIVVIIDDDLHAILAPIGCCGRRSQVTAIGDGGCSSIEVATFESIGEDEIGQPQVGVFQVVGGPGT